jgi:hypothetical protein
MKKLLNILMIILIYLSFCGKSCTDEDVKTTWQTKQAEMAKDTIRVEFESDYLTEEARYAAEASALQKLNDLADYTEIFSDQSLDTAFREKAGEMIRKIFISEDVRLSFGQMKNKKMKYVSLDEFLKKGFGDKIRKTEIIFDTIRVLEPLQKSDESTYSGKLAAFQTIVLYHTTDSIISSSKPITIHFISSKQNKIIGTDTLRVWEVSLGGLE